MNQKALKTLEYNKITELLEGFASSSMGKELCRNLTPLDNLAEIEAMQQETADALSRVYQKGSLSFGGVRDIRGSLKRLESAALWEPGNCSPSAAFWKMPTGPKPIPAEKQRMIPGTP